MSTACFYPQPIEETFAQIAEMGLRTIEVFFCADSEYSDPVLHKLEWLIRENGLTVCSAHPFTSGYEGILLFSEYKRRTEDALDQYRRYFEAAQRLGARYFTFHGERRFNQPARIPNYKLETYHRLVEAAAAYGVTFTQENVAWCCSADPAYLGQLYEAVPALRYTLDIKQAHRAGLDWSDYLDVIGDRVANIHLNDFSAAESCLLPGEGEMDYPAFFARLAALGYDRQVLIEVYRANIASVEQVRRAVQRLSPFAQP